tara:strand:- start:791 stop:967 length:177 start_codon:yes stop_codon:yes gene_type:complete
MITLFHGSPHDIKDKLKPSEPRGNDDFQRMKAVFATDKEKEKVGLFTMINFTSENHTH